MKPPIQTDVSLVRFNTFGIDARARWFARVESPDDFDVLRAASIWRSTPRFVLGGGSNVLFTRDFDGLVVQIATKGIRHLGGDRDDELVAAEAGEDWDAFVRTTVERGWPGLENLALIPGSVGASPVQNIGAYGIELAERFAWLEAVDLDTGETRTMDADACAFGYRDSVFKQAPAGRTAIVRVVFRLPKRWSPRRDYADVRTRLEAGGIDEPTPRDLLDAVTRIRREKLPDPRVVGNAGSFFKNPIVDATAFDALRAHEPGIVGYPEADGRVKVAAGWMIDRLGWRGRAMADDARAAVHDRQALVIVNRGGATGADVLALAAAIRDDVASRFGVVLETEPVFV